MTELPPLADNDAAVREVAWVARRARELSFGSLHGPRERATEWVEFYERKIRLLRYIGTPDSLALIEEAELHLARHREEAGA
jgi:hypothetical protein